MMNTKADYTESDLQMMRDAVRQTVDMRPTLKRLIIDLIDTNISALTDQLPAPAPAPVAPKASENNQDRWKQIYDNLLPMCSDLILRCRYRSAASIDDGVMTHTRSIQDDPRLNDALAFIDKLMTIIDAAAKGDLT